MRAEVAPLLCWLLDQLDFWLPYFLSSFLPSCREGIRSSRQRSRLPADSARVVEGSFEGLEVLLLAPRVQQLFEGAVKASFLRSRRETKIIRRLRETQPLRSLFCKLSPSFCAADYRNMARPAPSGSPNTPRARRATGRCCQSLPPLPVEMV